MKKHGFTLAETLITLTIIGVVAAMTIPTLMSKYQEKALESQFKKSYAMINQAISLNSQYECYIDEINYGDWSNWRQSECSDFWQNVFNNLKVVKDEKAERVLNGETMTSGATYPYKTPAEVRSEGGTVSQGINYPQNEDVTLRKYTFADGSALYASLYSNYLSNSAFFVTLDVNGAKGPNKWGYDVFYFYIAKNKNGAIKLSDTYYRIIEKNGKKPQEIILGTKK